MAKKSTTWFRRHQNDPWVKKAQAQGKRARAVFKLTQILQQQGMKIRPDLVIVDLGCAPGSWMAELAPHLDERGLLLGIDLLPMQAVQGAVVLQQDFASEAAQKALAEALGGRMADWVLSDIAPEFSGHKLLDQTRMIELNHQSLAFAHKHLKKGGFFLIKTFMGDGIEDLKADLRKHFSKVKSMKPVASRKASSEFYLLGHDYKGH